MRIDTATLFLAGVAILAGAAIYFATRPPSPTTTATPGSSAASSDSVASLVSGIGAGLTGVAASIARAIEADNQQGTLAV